MEVKDLIQELEAERYAMHMSYQTVATITKQSRSNVWKIMTGRTVPNFDTVLKIAQALRYSVVLKRNSAEEKHFK